MSDAEPQVEVANAMMERTWGLTLLLGLHVAFTLLTVVIAFVVPLDDFQPMELIEPWMLYIGLVQGIYAIPAALTLALMQRWQMLIGLGMGAGITLAATVVVMAFG